MPKDCAGYYRKYVVEIELNPDQQERLDRLQVIKKMGVASILEDFILKYLAEYETLAVVEKSALGKEILAEQERRRKILAQL